jgi:hypothetical protein
VVVAAGADVKMVAPEAAFPVNREMVYPPLPAAGTSTADGPALVVVAPSDVGLSTGGAGWSDGAAESEAGAGGGGGGAAAAAAGFNSNDGEGVLSMLVSVLEITIVSPNWSATAPLTIGPAPAQLI